MNQGPIYFTHTKSLHQNLLGCSLVIHQVKVWPCWWRYNKIQVERIITRSVCIPVSRQVDSHWWSHNPLYWWLNPSVLMSTCNEEHGRCYFWWSVLCSGEHFWLDKAVSRCWICQVKQGEHSCSLQHRGGLTWLMLQHLLVSQSDMFSFVVFLPLFAAPLD